MKHQRATNALYAIVLNHGRNWHASSSSRLKVGESNPGLEFFLGSEAETVPCS